uniref:THD domain-containing protein n=1 Tax=Taeniopygia guttata TaxID=59729 RepID=A0A674GUB2_TAEGU
MEAPAMLENGKNAPEKRRSTCLPVAFHPLIFVLIIISALVPIVFCLLHHQQAPGSCWAHGSLNESSTEDPYVLIWNWKLEHCNGIVQAQGQYLIIQQSGKYFIYAQLFRKETLKEPFTMMLYKNQTIALNNAVGHVNGTINFARPFFLQKGDKLSCKKNDKSDDSLLENQTYWGLFKM